VSTPFLHFFSKPYPRVGGSKYACKEVMDALISCPTILARGWRSRPHITATNRGAMPKPGASSCCRNDLRIDIHQGNSTLTDQNGALGRRDPVVTSAFPETALNFNGISADSGVFAWRDGFRQPGPTQQQASNRPRPGTESGLTPANDIQCTARTAPPPEP